MSNLDKKTMYLIDIYENPWAGTEGQLYKLLERISLHGYEPHMAVFKSSRYINNHNLPCDVKILGITSLLSFRAFIKMYRFSRKLKKDNFNLVHIYFNDASILAPIFLKLAGLKVVISRRDVGYWYNCLNLTMLRLNRFFVDRVVVNSNIVKSVTEEKEKYSTEKIKLIYNGFDFNVSAGKSEISLRSNLELNDDSVILGIVANLRPIKRMDDAIRALSLVLDEIENIHLVIIGEDEINKGNSLKQEYIELSNELSISENVHFMGVVKDVKPYVEQIDIGIMSSESEGLSNSIIEYMGASKPTVCTNCEGNAELIDDRETGILYETGNTTELAKALRLLIRDTELTSLMGKKAREKVEKKFEVGRYAAEYAQLYDELLN